MSVFNSIFKTKKNLSPKYSIMECNDIRLIAFVSKYIIESWFFKRGVDNDWIDLLNMRGYIREDGRKMLVAKDNSDEGDVFTVSHIEYYPLSYYFNKERKEVISGLEDDLIRYKTEIEYMDKIKNRTIIQDSRKDDIFVSFDILSGRYKFAKSATISDLVCAIDKYGIKRKSCDFII